MICVEDLSLLEGVHSLNMITESAFFQHGGLMSSFITVAATRLEHFSFVSH